MKTLILAGFLSAFAHNKCTMAELNGACKSCRKCPFTNSNFGCKKYGVTHHTPTNSEKKCLSQDASCGGANERCFGTKYVCRPGFIRPDGSSEYDVRCVDGFLDYGPACVPAVTCTASDTARSSVIGGPISNIRFGATVFFACKDGLVNANNSPDFASRCVVGSSPTVGVLFPNPADQCAVERTCSTDFDCSHNSVDVFCNASTRKCVECTERSHCAGNIPCSNNKCGCEAGLSAAGGECLPKCPGSSHCLPSSECVAADGSVRCPCYSVDSNGRDLEIKGTNLCINPCANRPQSLCENHRWCEWDFTCMKSCVHREENACLSEGCMWNIDVCLVDVRADRGSSTVDMSGLMVALIAALLCCLCCACLFCFVRGNQKRDPGAEKIASSMSSRSYSTNRNKRTTSARSRNGKGRRRPE